MPTKPAVRLGAASRPEDEAEARTFVFELAEAYPCRVEALRTDLRIAPRQRFASEARLGRFG